MLEDGERRPYQTLMVWMDEQALEARWEGFARQESLGWWRREHPEARDAYLDVDDWAERSPTGEIHWAGYPSRVHFLFLGAEQPKVKVLTRAATAEELQRLGHDRVPVHERLPGEPRFTALRTPEPAKPKPKKTPKSVQPSLEGLDYP